MISEVAPRPTSNYNAYLEAVRVAITQEPREWTFKSDPGYRTVLEHVTPEHGQRLLNWALAAEPNINDRLAAAIARRNDVYGQPVKHDGYSPSNWRYLAQAVRVWQYIDSIGLGSVHIVELGGGYGGLALYVDALKHLYQTPLRSYTIVDLPEATRLQAAYAGALDLPIRVANGLSLRDLYDLRPEAYTNFLISAYAFSEFDQRTRDWYENWLLHWCDYGIMWWNFPEPVMGDDGRQYGGPVYPFHHSPLTIEDDDPPIYPGHKIVRW